MRAVRPSRVPLQQEVMRLHNPIDPFPTDRCFADLPQGPIQKDGDSMVPVRRALIRHRLDPSEVAHIIGLAHALARHRAEGAPLSRLHTLERATPRLRLSFRNHPLRATAVARSVFFAAEANHLLQNLILDSLLTQDALYLVEFGFRSRT